MSLNDPLSNALSKLNSREKIGKKDILVKPISKMIKTVFDVMNEEGYVGTYEEIEDGKGNYLSLNLIGKVNKCGGIKPRFAVTLETYEKFEKRFLPARGFGILIVSTSQGIMTHQKAKEKRLGGKLLAYCY